MSLKSKYLLLIILLLVVSGAFQAGWYFGSKDVKAAGNKSIRLGQNRLTNPLLTCDSSSNQLAGDMHLAALKGKIEKVIARRIQAGLAADVSVYVSDLNTDNSIEINGSVGFEPASLVKLPLMMEYFKRAESDPSVLTTKLVYDGKQDWTVDQNYRPRQTLAANKVYTVDELINRMLVHSDNNAFRTLLTTADRNYLQEIHKLLGVETFTDASGARLVTTRSYAIFLKTLYNASFLNQEMSEKALRYLTRNDFNLGIDATVPDGITVASKFGERTTGANGEIKQLHDYGIVYYPHHPYLICVMTKGSDFLKLTEAIREISQLVFIDFDQHHKHGAE